MSRKQELIEWASLNGLRLPSRSNHFFIDYRMLDKLLEKARSEERESCKCDELTAENLTLRLALEQYEEPVEDDEPEDCSWCRGCGEGDYDGAACRKCHGTGVEPVERESDV